MKGIQAIWFHGLMELGEIGISGQTGEVGTESG